MSDTIGFSQHIDIPGKPKRSFAMFTAVQHLGNSVSENRNCSPTPTFLPGRTNARQVRLSSESVRIRNTSMRAGPEVRVAYKSGCEDSRVVENQGNRRLEEFRKLRERTIFPSTFFCDATQACAMRIRSRSGSCAISSGGRSYRSRQHARP